MLDSWRGPVAGLLILGATGAIASGAVIYSTPTPDGVYRVEISDREFTGIFETYRMLPLHPPGSGFRISGTPMVGWDVVSVAISADSQWVVSRKVCGFCLEVYYVTSPILGGPVVWTDAEIFNDGFESGGVTRWN